MAWWRHQMETFSALLLICAGNPPVPGEFPTQRPVTRSFDVYFDLRPNKRLSKQSWGWWVETLSRPFWRHRNGGTTHDAHVNNIDGRRCYIRCFSLLLFGTAIFFLPIIDRSFQLILPFNTPQWICSPQYLICRFDVMPYSIKSLIELWKINLEIWIRDKIYNSLSCNN